MFKFKRKLSLGFTLSLPKGFTLIELLVVIAIIGILVAIAGANFLTAQKQARDARRLQDLEGVQTSFETYYVINGTYPIDDSTIDAAFEGNTRPEDPSPAFAYSWDTEAGSYCICADLEAKTGNADGGDSTGCVWNSAGTKFCVQNKQ